MYSRWDLQPFILTKLPVPFKDIFARRRNTDTSVLLVASDEVRDRELTSEVVKGRDFLRQQSSCSASSDRSRNLIPGSMQDRLEGYYSYCLSRGYCNSAGLWQRNAVIADVSQDPSHLNSVSLHVFPAILRSSRFVNLVTDVPVTTMEHWIVQGFPHPDATCLSERLRQSFPCAKSLDELPLHVQRGMIGNSMHPIQIGLWLLYGILEIPASRDA